MEEQKLVLFVLNLYKQTTIKYKQVIDFVITALSITIISFIVLAILDIQRMVNILMPIPFLLITMMLRNFTKDLVKNLNKNVNLINNKLKEK